MLKIKPAKKSVAELCLLVPFLLNKVHARFCVALMLALASIIPEPASAQKPLTIGDQLPDVTVKNVINHPDTEFNLAQFKGKLLILDFWATWCAPCIAMLPKTDSLQKVFHKEMQFLPVTYEPREKVSKLLSKAKKLGNLSLPFVTDEKLLHTLFPHKLLPHYVWISPEGLVLATTGQDEINAENIRSMLSREKVRLAEKSDSYIKYNKEIPLLLADYGIQKDHIRFQSLLTAHIPGFSGRYDLIRNTDNEIQRITATNESIASLFRLAWTLKTSQTLTRNRIIYEVKDTTPLTSKERGALYKDWVKEHTYCYELILPANHSKNAADIMLRDLEFLFPQYQVSLEKRTLPCLSLIRTSDIDKIKTKGLQSDFSFSHYEAKMTNCSLDLLVAQLNVIYLQTLPTPVVNSTEYTSWVDLHLETNLTSVVSLREALKKYDLDLVLRDQEVDMLIIRDSN